MHARVRYYLHYYMRPAMTVGYAFLDLIGGLRKALNYMQPPLSPLKGRHMGSPMVLPRRIESSRQRQVNIVAPNICCLLLDHGFAFGNGRPALKSPEDRGLSEENIHVGDWAGDHTAFLCPAVGANGRRCLGGDARQNGHPLQHLSRWPHHPSHEGAHKRGMPLLWAPGWY